MESYVYTHTNGYGGVLDKDWHEKRSCNMRDDNNIIPVTTMSGHEA